MGTEAAIVGGSIVSGLLGNKAAKTTANVSNAASEAAIAEQARQYDLNRQDLAPWMQSGKNSLSAYNQALGLPYIDYSKPLASENDGTATQNNVPRQVLASEIDRRIQKLRSNEYMASENQLLAIRGQIYDLERQKEKILAGAAQAQSPGQQAQSPGQTVAQPQYEQMPGTGRPAETPLPQYAGAKDFRFDPSQMRKNPAYNFLYNEAMRGTNRNMAAQGKAGSGNVLAALQDRAAGLASTEYGAEFNRQLNASNTNYSRDIGEYGLDYARANDIYGRNQNYLNRLASLSGAGQLSAGQIANMGTNMANNIGNIQMGNASNQANAAGMRYGAMNNAIQGGLQNYMLYDYLNNNGGK